jgi:hypothetical protein
MFSVTISTLSESEKKVLKFKRLFYAQGTEVLDVEYPCKNHSFASENLPNCSNAVGL